MAYKHYFLSDDHLKKWLRESPQGQSILHELLAKEWLHRREVLLVVVGTFTGEWGPHTQMRIYTTEAVEPRIIQAPHCCLVETEPLAEDYVNLLARKLPPRYRVLLDEYGELPNRPRLEVVVQRRTAESILQATWERKMLAALDGLRKVSCK
jgi:hypothetical protein